jgi:hypothetical protein
LTNAGKKQAEMARELSMLQLEKQEVETMMGMDLQAAEETIAAMEKEIPRLEELDNEVKDLRVEKEKWEKEKEELRERAEKAEMLHARLADQEMKKGEAAGGAERMLAELRQTSQRELDTKDAEIRQIKEDFERERKEWEQERQMLEDEKMDDLARLHEEVDRVREEDDAAMQAAQEEVRAGLAALQALISAHGIVLFARDASLQGLLNAVGVHLDAVHVKLDAHANAEAEWNGLRRKLEEDLRAGMDKREALARELEDARKERDAAKRETMSMESQANAQTMRHMRTPSAAYTPLPASVHETTDGDAARIISALLPLWAVLPSPEARAAKFGANASRSFRTGSPTPGSPSAGSSNGSVVVSSLSDLDVRSLKTLYSNKDGANGTPVPISPRTIAGGKGNSAPFSIEAFAARVQALVADDRALIERLMRFAQAHDLLKKNAERAQKLAQDGTHALETYQKQVRVLEERNSGLASKHAAMYVFLGLCLVLLLRILTCILLYFIGKTSSTSCTIPSSALPTKSASSSGSQRSKRRSAPSSPTRTTRSPRARCPWQRKPRRRRSAYGNSWRPSSRRCGRTWSSRRTRWRRCARRSRASGLRCWTSSTRCRRRTGA